MEHIDRNKYVVFKREDFEPRMNALVLEVDESIPRDIRSVALDDCVVIRLQDVFAASALQEYANQIDTALTVVEHVCQQFDGEKVEHLLALRDFFADAARAAEVLHSKVPD